MTDIVRSIREIVRRIERKSPDILSDLSETEVHFLSDPRECILVYDRTNEISFGERNGEVENRPAVSCRSLTTIVGKQVNSGLEINI